MSCAIAALQKHSINLSYQTSNVNQAFTSAFTSFRKVDLKIIWIPRRNMVTFEGNHKNLRICKVLPGFQKISWWFLQVSAVGTVDYLCRSQCALCYVLKHEWGMWNDCILLGLFLLVPSWVCKACPAINQLNVTSFNYLFLRISKLDQSTIVSW